MRIDAGAIAKLAASKGLTIRSASGDRIEPGDLRAASPRRAGDGNAERKLFELVKSAFPGEWIEREYPIDTRSADGLVHRRRVDVAFPKRLICIEADGWRFHARYPRAFQEHTARQNELILAGWRPLRYTRAMIEQKEAVVWEITRLLGGLGMAQDPVNTCEQEYL